MMQASFFQKSNGEMGLTKRTQALIAAAKEREPYLQHWERIVEWTNNTTTKKE